MVDMYLMLSWWAAGLVAMGPPRHVVEAGIVIGASTPNVDSAKGGLQGLDSLKLATRGRSLAFGLKRVKAVWCVRA